MWSRRRPSSASSSSTSPARGQSRGTRTASWPASASVPRRSPSSRWTLAYASTRPVVVDARGGGRLLGGVGHQPRRAPAAPSRFSSIGEPGRQRRQRGQLAVVREREQHGADLGRGHGRRGRPAQRAGGDVARDAVDLVAVDDAQALADAVLRVGPLAALDRHAAVQALREHLGHRQRAQQRVAARHGGVGRELGHRSTIARRRRTRCRRRGSGSGPGRRARAARAA